MSNFLKIAALLLCFASTLNLQAQTANTEEAKIIDGWNSIWQAYQTGNTEAMWAAYTEEATEIGPDGSLTVGKKALRESWAAFMKMVDAPPTFTYEQPVVRIITADVAIITWYSTADIKVGGQQFARESLVCLELVERQYNCPRA